MNEEIEIELDLRGHSGALICDDVTEAIAECLREKTTYPARIVLTQKQVNQLSYDVSKYCGIGASGPIKEFHGIPIVEAHEPAPKHQFSICFPGSEKAVKAK